MFLLVINIRKLIHLLVTPQGFKNLKFHHFIIIFFLLLTQLHVLPTTTPSTTQLTFTSQSPFFSTLPPTLFTSSPSSVPINPEFFFHYFASNSAVLLPYRPSCVLESLVMLLLHPLDLIIFLSLEIGIFKSFFSQKDLDFIVLVTLRRKVS